MPTYTFRTPSGDIVNKRLSFSVYEDVKAGKHRISGADGAPLELVFNPGDVAFVLKDGVSGGWTSKTLKESKYRLARNGEMARREKDHVFKSRLVPNYQGEEAHSWADVQDHVRTTKGEVSASTYQPLVAKERST
jgi:hypothetical protein